MKESFIVHTAFYEPIKGLSDKQLGRLFRALFDYQLGDYSTDSGVQVEDDVRMAFLFFKNQMDIDELKYQERIAANKQNGSRGGAPKGNSNARGKQPKTTETTDWLKNNRWVEKTTETTLNDNDNDNDNVNDSLPPTPPRGQPERESVENAVFSFLPKELQDALEIFWLVHAEAGNPIFAIQQELLVKDLLTKTGNDYAKALEWAKASAAGKWKRFYDPNFSVKQNNPNKPKTYALDEDAKRKQDAEYARLFGSRSEV